MGSAPRVRPPMAWIWLPARFCQDQFGGQEGSLGGQGDLPTIDIIMAGFAGGEDDIFSGIGIPAQDGEQAISQIFLGHDIIPYSLLAGAVAVLAFYGAGGSAPLP